MVFGVADTKLHKQASLHSAHCEVLDACSRFLLFIRFIHQIARHASWQGMKPLPLCTHELSRHHFSCAVRMCFQEVAELVRRRDNVQYCCGAILSTAVFFWVWAVYNIAAKRQADVSTFFQFKY